jgi:hypothetical protein
MRRLARGCSARRAEELGCFELPRKPGPGGRPCNAGRFGGWRRRVEYHEGMRWKQSLTPLQQVPDLDADRLDRLAAHHITTAEELVGEIDASPEGVGQLLDMDEVDVLELARRALQASNPDVAAAMEQQRGRRYKLGALPPRAAGTD